MQIKANVPQNIVQVFDQSLRLFRASWLRVWPFALGGALAGYAGNIYRSFVADAAAERGTMMLIALAGSILSLVFYSAIYLRQDAIAAGRPRGGEMEVSFQRLPRLMLMTLVMSLIIAVAALPLAVFVSANRWSPQVMTAGIMLLSIPPLVLIINLLFGTVGVLLEDKKASESLQASYRLVKGNWWRTAALLMIGLGIAIVANAVAGTVVRAAAPLLVAYRSAVTAIFAVLATLVFMGLLVTPYFIALMLSMYYDLKSRHEGANPGVRTERAV